MSPAIGSSLQGPYRQHRLRRAAYFRPVVLLSSVLLSAVVAVLAHLL